MATTGGMAHRVEWLAQLLGQSVNRLLGCLQSVARGQKPARLGGLTSRAFFPCTSQPGVSYCLSAKGGYTLNKGNSSLTSALYADRTPAGVGPLKAGDVVEVEVEGIGVLRNPVAAP